MSGRSYEVDLEYSSANGDGAIDEEETEDERAVLLLFLFIAKYYLHCIVQ